MDNQYSEQTAQRIYGWITGQGFALREINPDFTIKPNSAESLAQGTRYLILKQGEDIANAVDAKLVPEEEMKKMPKVVINHKEHYFNSILMREADVGLGTSAGTWLSYERFAEYSGLGE